MSFLDLIPEDYIFNDADKLLREKIFQRGFALLRKFCNHNPMGQQVCFSGQCFEHFRVLYIENSYILHYLINDLIIQNENLLLIEENQNVFNLILNQYLEVNTQFGNEFTEFLENGNLNGITVKTLS